MRTSYRPAYGPPELLSIREAENPSPKPKQLLIRVSACTVNRTDCGVLRGEPYIFRFFAGWPHPRTTATGTDFAGTVEAVGSAVTAFRPGDRVFGFNDEGCGSHAEYVTFPADGAVLRIPDGIGFEEAVASLEGAHYALNFILHSVSVIGNRQPKTDDVAERLAASGLGGMSVMVYGATGAIGSAAVQLLRYFGCRVVAVCATPHLERVEALGADRVLDYTAEGFTRCGEQFDFVFDAVGKSDFSTCKPLMKDRGVYVSSELGPGNENLYLPLTTRMKGGKRVVFPLPMDIPRTLRLMGRLLAEGRFKPLIDRAYPLDRLADAFRYVASGQKVGNVILRL